MLLHDEYQRHRMVVDALEISCACGERLAGDWMDDKDVSNAQRAFYDHQGEVVKHWLHANQFGAPVPYLPVNVFCLRCGCLVGLPDAHRRACALVEE